MGMSFEEWMRSRSPRVLREAHHAGTPLPALRVNSWASMDDRVWLYRGVDDWFNLGNSSLVNLPAPCFQYPADKTDAEMRALNFSYFIEGILPPGEVPLEASGSPAEVAYGPQGEQIVELLVREMSFTDLELLALSAPWSLELLEMLEEPFLVIRHPYRRRQWDTLLQVTERHGWTVFRVALLALFSRDLVGKVYQQESYRAMTSQLAGVAGRLHPDDPQP